MEGKGREEQEGRERVRVDRERGVRRREVTYTSTDTPQEIRSLQLLKSSTPLSP